MTVKHKIFKQFHFVNCKYAHETSAELHNASTSVECFMHLLRQSYVHNFTADV